MTKEFLFVEEGSVDTNNMLKFLQNSGLNDASIIRYKQGAPKPELVSISSDPAELIAAVEKGTIDNVLDILAKFLDANTETIAQTDVDVMRGLSAVVCKTVYRGTADDLIRDFKELLNKHIGPMRID